MRSSTVLTDSLSLNMVAIRTHLLNSNLANILRRPQAISSNRQCINSHHLSKDKFLKREPARSARATSRTRQHSRRLIQAHKRRCNRVLPMGSRNLVIQILLV
jgi:hypothetical protein